MEEKKDLFEFYTDGACSTKTTMGGWAYVCLINGSLINKNSGCEPYTTGNRMELYAFIGAFSYIFDNLEEFFDKGSFRIYTDSAYIANCLNNGWYRRWLNNGWKRADRKKVLNQDLWKQLITYYIKIQKRIPDFQVLKVQAHKQNKWNNYVDKEAVQCRKLLEKED